MTHVFYFLLHEYFCYAFVRFSPCYYPFPFSIFNSSYLRCKAKNRKKFLLMHVSRKRSIKPSPRRYHSFVSFRVHNARLHSITLATSFAFPGHHFSHQRAQHIRTGKAYPCIVSYLECFFKKEMCSISFVYIQFIINHPAEKKGVEWKFMVGLFSNFITKWVCPFGTCVYLYHC